MITLEAVSSYIWPGLVELIHDLGSGEHGFSGTPVASGEMTLDEYLLRCTAMTDPANLQPGLVPQTVFWVIDGEGEAVGMVRVRHFLNEKLKDRGGHIGYYIRRDQRGKGYGQEALRMALQELQKFGETHALLTVDLDNPASIRVIEANRGALESAGQGEDGRAFGRYWIDMPGKSKI